MGFRFHLYLVAFVSLVLMQDLVLFLGSSIYGDLKITVTVINYNMCSCGADDRKWGNRFLE